MRLIPLDTLRLVNGSGQGKEDRFCVMEAASVFDPDKGALKVNGIRVTDAPDTVSRVIRSFLIRLNDGVDDEARQLLVPLIPKVLGTNTGDKDDETRRWMLVDWAVHTATPKWLERAGLTEEAKKLRDLPVIDSRKAVTKAEKIIDAVRDASYTKRSASYDALRERVKDQHTKAVKWLIDAVARLCWSNGWPGDACVRFADGTWRHDSDCPLHSRTELGQAFAAVTEQ